MAWEHHAIVVEEKKSKEAELAMAEQAAAQTRRKNEGLWQCVSQRKKKRSRIEGEGAFGGEGVIMSKPV